MNKKDYLKLLSENEVVKGIQLVISDLLENFKTNGPNEYNITIQIPEPIEGNVYPEIILDAYLFSAEQYLSLDNLRVISRKPLNKEIEFNICTRPLNNDDETIVYKGKLTNDNNNVVITDIGNNRLDTGYLYVKLVKCNDNKASLDFILNLKIHE